MDYKLIQHFYFLIFNKFLVGIGQIQIKISFKLLIQSMSFCQKHSNHHCVHNHSCKDPTHDKRNNRKKAQQNNSRSQHQLEPIQQENDQCAFTFQEHFVNHGQSSSKQAQEYKSKIKSLQIQNMKIREQYDKVELENKHLECQMDYLRQELQRILSNSSADIKVQIQKHLQQNKKLCLRIKQLALQNQDLSNKLIDKQNNMDSYRINSIKYKKQRDDQAKKLKVLQQKCQKQAIRKIQLNKKNINYEDLNKEMQSKYAALSKQSQFTIQQFSDQMERLKNDIQKISRQNQRLKGKQAKTLQLHQVDVNLWKQKETKLNVTIAKLKQSFSNQQQNNKSLKQKIQVLQENYQHSKKIILKLKQAETNLQNFNQTIKVNQVIKVTDNFQNKTVPKLQSEKNSLEILEKCSILEKQNFQLKAQLDKFHEIQRPLKTHNHNISIQQCEQYILKIGASEAFKKIIQQKNKIITNLIKEKSKVNQKLFQNQVHRK